jgi:hypothetical protein
VIFTQFMKHCTPGKMSYVAGRGRIWEGEAAGVKARRAIKNERSTTLYRGPTEQERNLVDQLSELLSREEIMEKQRSRVSWLREGDRNTKFFQAKARARGRTNRIRSLKRADGTVVLEQGKLEQLASLFYQDLFRHKRTLPRSWFVDMC